MIRRDRSGDGGPMMARRARAGGAPDLTATTGVRAGWSGRRVGYVRMSVWSTVDVGVASSVSVRRSVVGYSCMQDDDDEGSGDGTDVRTRVQIWSLTPPDQPAIGQLDVRGQGGDGRGPPGATTTGTRRPGPGPGGAPFWPVCCSRGPGPGSRQARDEARIVRCQSPGAPGDLGLVPTPHGGRV